MGDAVQRPLRVGAVGDELLDVSGEQPELHESLRLNPRGGLLDVVVRRAGPDLRDRGLLRREHDFVDRPLLRREAAVRRIRAGHVARVVLVLRPGVIQDDVAVADLPVVLLPMEEYEFGPDATIDG